MPRPAHRHFPPGPGLILALAVAAMVAGCQLAPPGTGAGVDAALTPNAVAGDTIEVTALDAAPLDASEDGAVVQAESATVSAEGPSPVQTSSPSEDAATLDAVDTEVAKTEAAAEPAPQPDETPVEQEAPKSEFQVLCEKRGGNWTGIGSSLARICIFETRDSGKQCDRESDCESVCLARSRTCAPVRPLLGCNEILQDNGARVTLCFE